jgi:hypothetical protein
MADVWRNQEGWRSFESHSTKRSRALVYILIFNITISLLSRNGQHGMDQWIACSLLSEGGWDVIGSPVMLFAAGLDQ